MTRAAWAWLVVLAACGGPAAPPTATPAPLAAVPPDAAPAPDEAAPATGEPATEPLRAEAIAKLEAFIAANPGDARFAPDALVRLGVLQLDAYEDALARGDRPAAVAAVAAAIAALARAEAFPAYERRPVAAELLAEARFRAGDLAFEDRRLDDAVAAYTAAAAVPGARVQAAALYKLGWSHYRKDAFADAIAAFQAMLDLGDDPAAAELRAEAVQYIAISLVERDWDLDGADDPAPRGARATASVARVAAHLGDGASASRRAIAEAAGKALAEEARFAEAAAVYRLVLAVTTEPAARARLADALARASRGSP